MELDFIVKHLNLKVRSGSQNLSADVTGGYVGDLLSDVIANSKEGDIWITRQIHQNIVAVATLKDLAGIILVANNEPARETLEKARLATGLTGLTELSMGMTDDYEVAIEEGATMVRIGRAVMGPRPAG